MARKAAGESAAGTALVQASGGDSAQTGARAATASAASTSENAHGSLATDPLPVVFVNKANIGEIKGALDDIVKKHLSGLSFTPSLVHPTVHLALGYTSIAFALGSAGYAFKMPFEESKPVLWVGVAGYFVLQALLWAWKRWVEQGEVFSGRRRRVVKRIETDIVHVMSSTSFDPPPPQPQITFSPHTRPSSPSSPSSTPSSPAQLSPSASSKPLDPAPAPARAGKPSPPRPGPKPHTGPTYALHLCLSTTSNNGKSLIHKSRVVAGRGIGEFVDTHGGVEEGEVVRWLSGLLVDAGLVGAEDEGTKEE